MSEPVLNRVKARLARSSAGRALFMARSNLQLRRLSGSNPEKAGMIANEIIADKLIARICPKGGTFLDIGAHYGAIFSFAHLFDNTITVHAFEADGRKVQSLRTSYPYAHIHHIAVGEREGEATFYLNDKAAGYNSLVPDKELEPSKVRIAAIDELLPDASADVIKIDIEGAELGALIGAEKLIARSLPTIMFECVLREENALGYSAEKIWDWLDERGFEIHSPDRVAHAAPSFSKATFCDAQHYPFRSINYFAIASEKRAQVRERAKSILGIE